jgi:hypothetical protein
LAASKKMLAPSTLNILPRFELAPILIYLVIEKS